ncbi:MAG: NAD-dependent epimerase/dehydratase family protein, partial [Deltaproteobacteria bacterium]
MRTPGWPAWRSCCPPLPRSLGSCCFPDRRSNRAQSENGDPLMKVMLTGGTGFVGSHLLESLLAAGHDVRLLARSEAKVKRVLREQGIEIQDVVYGDMTDADTVREALTGCDCVIHAAAAVEISSQRSVLDSNIAGNHNVLGSAVSLGLDPIVYVSSIATM